MESCKGLKSPQTETDSYVIVRIIVIIPLIFAPVNMAISDYEFTLLSRQNGVVLPKINWTNYGPGNQMSPVIFSVDLVDLFPYIRDRNRFANLAFYFAQQDFYLCPGNPVKAYCNDVSEFLCPYWDCVTIATSSWVGGNDTKTISFWRGKGLYYCRRGRKCNPAFI